MNDEEHRRNSEYQRRYRLTNKMAVARYNRKARWNKKLWVSEYKSRPCADCDVEYPYYVMDLDHRDPKQKTDSVPILLRNGAGWSVLKAEVAKCDVVCANCHRQRSQMRLAAQSGIVLTTTVSGMNRSC